MKKIEKYNYILHNTQGFAIILALMALLVLTVVGTLVFTVTTKDIRTATRVSNEKKAFSGAESGFHYLITKTNEFAKDPNIETLGFKSRLRNFSEVSTIVNPSIDQYTKYSIPAGYSGVALKVIKCDIVATSIGEGGEAPKPSGDGVLVHKSVLGEHTISGSKVQLDFGLCYGPVQGGT